MKSFKIGSYVRVTAISEVGYIEYPKRTLIRIPVEPFFAEVVGKAVKQTGTYCAAKGGGLNDFADYTPAYLRSDGTVTLWEVRTGMINRPILVHDDDLESVGGIVDGVFPIPNRGIKPKRIADEVYHA